MKKTNYIIAAATLANILAICLVAVKFSGFGGHVRTAALACCGAGALGVTWLGWYSLNLTKAVTSIAAQLNEKQTEFSAAFSNPHANLLCESVENYLKDNSSYVNEIENRLSDTELKVQLLRNQKRNTDAIIHSIRDAVIVIDGYGKMVLASEAAANLFEFDHENSLYKEIDQLVQENKKQFVTFLKNCTKSKSRASKRELQFIEDERPITFDCTVSCVYDAKNEVCGAVAVLHDITREKEVAQMKNDFVNHVSHELKTPLASITAYSEMLVDGEADDEETRKDFYSVIQSQAKRLSRLIEDMLNISRIESGLIKVAKEPISLALLIEEQMQMIKGYAEEKNIKVFGQQTIVFDQVFADKDMISQVVVNLLSNAVKYTRSGGSITINLEVDDLENLARVTVTDTGVGIPPEAVDHVFDKFYRVKANNSVAKGTGLGLNLVKKIVEKVHGGRVFVKSTVGEGSTFGFELPLVSESAMQTA